MVSEIIPITNTPPGLGVFSYLVPKNSEGSICVGQLVKISFRGKKTLGVVVSLNTSDFSVPSKLLTIDSIITPGEIIPNATVNLVRETANLHHSSAGQLLKSSLPNLGPRAIKKILDLTLVKTPDLPKTTTKPEYKIIHKPKDYIKIISQAGAVSGQTLILTPDLQTLNNLTRLLPGSLRILTLTSQTTVSDYSKIWQIVRQGEPAIVLGTRRSLFLPFVNLHQIIVTEEGNQSYKSFDSAPRYQTEDVAIRLSELTGSQIVFYSHSPSVSKINSFSEEPPVFKNATIINMKEERASGNTSILSVKLETELKKCFGNVLLLLNRLGEITSVSCRDCDYRFTCPNCARSLVLYHKNSELRCNYCSITHKFSPTCPNCKGANLKMFGAGTQALEKAILNRSWSKNYTVLRLDNSSNLKFLPTTKKPYLIIGTDFALRYISLLDVKLVGVLDPDSSLFIPEYRATENIWMKLRNLRFWIPASAQLLIQTRNLENPAIQGVIFAKTFYLQEMIARRLFQYPPYQKILKIFKSGPRELLSKEADNLYKHLQSLTLELKLATIEPPKPAFPAVLNGVLRLIIIVKLPPNLSYLEMSKLVANLPRGWKIDWNPESLLTV